MHRAVEGRMMWTEWKTISVLMEPILKFDIRVWETHVMVLDKPQVCCQAGALHLKSAEVLE